jgi:hypothetical protein
VAYVVHSYRAFLTNCTIVLIQGGGGGFIILLSDYTAIFVGKILLYSADSLVFD